MNPKLLKAMEVEISDMGKTAVRNQPQEHSMIQLYQMKFKRQIPMDQARSLRIFTIEGGYRIIISRGKTENGVLWHLSVSYPGRTCTWEEMKAIKYTFFPDLAMMQVFPKEEDFYSLDDCTALHLFEMPFEWKRLSSL